MADDSPSVASLGTLGAFAPRPLAPGVFSQLEAVYGSVPEAFRFTRGGIFLATPVPVVMAALTELFAFGFLGPALKVLDAGSGDGRLAFALACAEETMFAVGVECDEALDHEARRYVSALSPGRRPRLRVGDYLRDEVFAESGARFADFDCVFHYPDGNESPLYDRMAREGKPSTKLVLLSPQIGNPLAHPCIERRIDTALGNRETRVAWYLRIYEPARIRVTART